MPRQPVTSSNLRSVGYDPMTHILEIEFHSGDIYRYSGVPQGVFDGLLRAGSKGSCFHSNIKGCYPYTRVG